MTLELAAKAIGRRVVYLPGRRFGNPESGVIASVDETFVFVRFSGNVHSAATRPEDLELEEPAPSKLERP